MIDSEVRTKLLARLAYLAERLPNGLLYRLVEDAQFFYDWNLRKKQARKSARVSQLRSWEVKADNNYWKSVKDRIG
jgi:hypothetical protein